MTKTLILSLLLLFLLIPLPLCAADSAPLSFADSLAAEGEHYRAITEYKRFLHHSPDAPEASRARLSIARSLIAGKRWNDADLALETVMTDDAGTPEATAARLIYADIAFDRSNYPLARKRYLSLLENDANRYDFNHAHYRIGWTFLEEEQVEEARRSFAQLEPDRSAELSAALDDFQQLPQKSPGLAGTLSAILPGAGQLYTGRTRQAALAFALNAIFIYGTIEAFDNDNNAVGGIMLLFTVGWYTGNIYNAVNNAHKFNQRQKAKYKGEMRERFGLHLGWGDDHPMLLARLRF